MTKVLVMMFITEKMPVKLAQERISGDQLLLLRYALDVIVND